MTGRGAMGGDGGEAAARPPILAPAPIVRRLSALLRPASAPPRPARSILVSTVAEIAGYRITRHFGLVRGAGLRSRPGRGNPFGNFQSLFARTSNFARLAETARQEAYDRMCLQADELGANAIVGMRYDTAEILPTIAEVLAYGTAVWAEATYSESAGL